MASGVPLVAGTVDGVGDEEAQAGVGWDSEGGTQVVLLPSVGPGVLTAVELSQGT